MIKNYLLLALRNMRRHKGYSFINIAGLAVGMACCILLVLYIHSELSVDNQHQKGDRIYRLCAHVKIGDMDLLHSSSNALSAQALLDEVPEVENTVRFYHRPGANTTYQDKEFYIRRINYADASVFDIFTWPLIKGDPRTALSAPYSIVLSEDTARGCFGDEDPLGKLLRFNDDELYTVTGVMENIPRNSSLILDAVCSFQTVYSLLGADHPHLNDWISFNFRTFVLLRENVDYHKVDKKIMGQLTEKAGARLEAKGAEEEIFLYPLKDIYLRPLGQDVGPIQYVTIFSIVALFILIIACVNFMNLATARSAGRAREVGMRKVMGAYKSRLVTQFLGESLLLSAISLFIAVTLVQLALPQINRLTRGEIRFDLVEIPWLLPGLLGLTLLVGIMAGSYPAFYLSAFQPVEVLNRRLKRAASNIRFRRLLVVVQFTISIALIIGTALFISQLRFMKNKDAGFDKDQLVVVRARERATQKSLPMIKQELEAHQRIIHVSASSTIPGWGSVTNDKLPEGFTRSEIQLMDEINVDGDFIPTMGMEIIAGRNFSPEFGMDEKNSVIINETAARRYGWDDPIGKTIMANNPYARGYARQTVIGMVKDFHLRPMSQSVEPIYMLSDPDFPYSYNYLDLILIRIGTEEVGATIEFIRNKWSSLFPEEAFDYFFLEETFNEQFRSIERSREIFSSFTLLAIFISCLGLFRLASFSAEQRTKEIGIRKVLGSSTWRIVLLLSKETLLLVAIANAVAWPTAYFALNRWLQGFPYRISLTLIPFVLSALLVLFISFSTISYQAIRAAQADPVESLKYD